MPASGEHLTWAERNEKAAERLLQSWQDELADWAVTMLFYAAVHFARAYVLSKGTAIITSHLGFDSLFFRSGGDPNLHKLYRRLKDESEAARYDCRRYRQEDVLKLRTSFYEPLKNGLLKEIPRKA